MAGAPRRSRFVNRLTPMVMMGKATEKGLEEVARAVLGEVFGVVGEGEKKDHDGEENGTKEDPDEEKAGISVRTVQHFFVPDSTTDEASMRSVPRYVQVTPWNAVL